MLVQAILQAVGCLVIRCLASWIKCVPSHLLDDVAEIVHVVLISIGKTRGIDGLLEEIGVNDVPVDIGNIAEVSLNIPLR